MKQKLFSFFIHLQDHRGRRSGKGSMRYLDTGDRYQVRLQSNTLCNCAMQNTRKGILPLFLGQLPSKITFDIPSLKGIEEHILRGNRIPTVWEQFSPFANQQNGTELQLLLSR